jgi:flavin reductase (DIM6/NTAB) family NADH-FMN oxidoreductase RutF
MDPPLVLWSVDKSSKRAPYFLNANHFAIHILEEGQGDLCWRSSKDMRGLRPDDYTQNAQGVPLLHGCLARFECSQYAMHDAGDHHIIIGRVHHVSMNTQAGGLGFFRGKLGRFSAQE